MFKKLNLAKFLTSLDKTVINMKTRPEPYVIVNLLIKYARKNKRAVILSATTLREIAGRSRLEKSIITKIKHEAAKHCYLFTQMPSGDYLMCTETMLNRIAKI